MLAACGPAIDLGMESHGSGDGTTTTSSSGSASATAVLDGETSMTAQDEGPRYDVQVPPTPMGACGAPLPEDCEPTWPLAQEIADRSEASAIDRDGTLEIVLSPRGGNPEPEYIWAMSFTMPCPTVPQGPPDIPSESRFIVEGIVEIRQAAEFEYTLVGSYPSTLDVELLNACAHVQLHAVDVESVPLPPDTEPYAWPELPPLGYFRADTFED